MTADIVVGLLLALASAAALNWGYYAQHGAANALPPLSARRPIRSLASLFRNRRWVLGFFVGIGGWVLYVVALAFAPLSLVQAASAGGIALLALLVGRLARIERIAVACAVGGLALLATSLVRAEHIHSHANATAVALWMGGSAAVAAIAAALPLRRLAGGVGFGVAAGCLYAAGDVGTKAAVGGGGRLAFVPALLACHGLAFVALQLGFQRGGALATAGMATLWTNALPIAAGTIVFHEGIPPGLRGAARLVAFVALVVAAALLAQRSSETPRVPSRRRVRRMLRAVGVLVVVFVASSSSVSAQNGPIPGFTIYAASFGGGTVWAGRIRDPYVPSDTRLTDIYLPPDYSPAERYPVLYLLHGFWGAPSSFVAGFKLGTTADELIDDGAARPFIAVMPPGGPATKTATGEWAGPWEDFVMRTVVPWTDRHLPTIRSADARAIGGFSAGGYGAVDMALRHLGTFGVAESWDGYFHPFRDGPLARATPAALAAHNPTLLVRTHAATVRRDGLQFFLSTGGSHGPVSQRWTRDFAHELSTLHVVHSLWVLPVGEHGFGRTQLPAALRYAEPPI